MAVVPVLIMGIVAMVISNTIVKDKLLDDTKQKLRATAKSVLAAYDQNTGDYFQNETGDVWKGAYNVSKSTPFVDDIQKKTGMAITFFYGDQRLVTSLVDKDGKRITGSKAGDFLKDNVLKDGNDVFTNRVLVDGEFYFGYYVPVHQNNSDEVVGMIFAGIPVKEVTGSLNLIIGVFTVAIVVILLLTIIVCTLTARGIAKSIHDSVEVVEQISEGNLHVDIPDSSLQRKDEVGALSISTKRLIDNLSNIIGNISNNAMTLNSSAEEMNAAASLSSDAVENINDNLQNVLSGAREQTDNVQNVQHSVDNINLQIEKTLAEVGKLSDAANQMMAAGNQAQNTLEELNLSNQDVLKEIENIQQQTSETNASVEQIMKAVSFISDIAEQTNLLSLNASIEAARAGEAGRGFSVVAEEISKLANQSNEASEEISNIVKALDYNSARTMEIMNSVESAISEQTSNVKDTAKNFSAVQTHITNVAGGVDVIRESTNELMAETGVITRDIQALSDIAESNEGTVSGTISYSDEVLHTVNSVTDMSSDVSESANDMADAISHFHM